MYGLCRVNTVCWKPHHNLGYVPHKWQHLLKLASILDVVPLKLCWYACMYMYMVIPVNHCHVMEHT